MKRKAAEEIAVKILIGKDYSMKKEAGQLLNRYQQLVPSDNEPTRYYEITEKGIIICRSSQR
ncbi:MAG: hypothetical protein ACRD4W_09505 [Nitrososphaeraceae archaeon]